MIKRIKSLEPIYKKIFAILILLTITSFSISFVRASSSIDAGSSPIFPKLYTINDDFIFYTSLYDNKIYRMNLVDSEKIKISNDNIGEDGIILWNQWIYYFDSSDHNLYRMKDDGSSKIRLGNIKKQTGDDSFFVWENHLYYIDSELILHKINSHGEEINILDDKEYEILFRLNSKAVKINNFVYIPGQEGIIKIDVESGDRIKLCEDWVYDNIIVMNNGIYYINREDYKLYRISTDGSEKIKISDDMVITEGADYDTGSFNIIEDAIYYTCNKGGTAKLVKVDLDGQNKSVIVEKVVDFTTDDKYIYYFDDVDNGGLYRIKLDGGSKKRVAEGSFLPYISLEQNLIVYVEKSSDISQPHDGRLFILNQNRNLNIELK